MRKIFLLAFVILTGSLLNFQNLSAQTDLKYQLPPQEIYELANYERAPSVWIDRDMEYMVLSYRDTYKTLDQLKQPEMKLAGMRINPDKNIESGVSYLNNLKVRKVSEKEEIQVQGLPRDPKIAYVSYSPDQKYAAFTHTGAKHVELWILDIANAQARKLSDLPLNANMGSPLRWMKDGNSLIINVVPSDRGALIEDEIEAVTGPIISESDGKEAQNRTYQDLLKNKADEYNFEQLIRSELRIIDLNGVSKIFLPANMYAGLSFSPDCNYVMVTTIERPYSYVVPSSRFPQKSVVYDNDGKVVKLVNEVPLLEALPKAPSSVREGKRGMMWRSDKPATLVYAVPLDGGDGAVNVEYRDEVFQWEAPFDKAAVSMFKSPQRFSRIQWANDKYAFFVDSWSKTRNTKTYVFNPSDPSVKPVVLFDRNTQDIYSNPGNMYTSRNEFDRNVVHIDKDNIILIGDGYSPQGQFPFIDQMNLKTGKKTTLYRSTYTDKKESILSIEDLKKGLVLVQLQSKNEYPNYYLRNIRKKASLEQLTFFKNPYESIANVHKEVIKYKREDGVELSGTLYLPVGYDMNKKEKVPLLIWAYPREYNDASLAGQSTHNPNTFTALSYGSFIYWVTRGYAVLDDAAFPIIGENGEEPNDTFVEQLVANAKAAIDAVDELGYIDRKKVAVGGHSYGAFMTANLLTHCDLFVCGIARSGAYNRTLTPFGFQNEQRNYWEAKDVYTDMSPFMNAEKMKYPILLIHGQADNNTGTFTLQSERYFQALKALGAPARLVLLPLESHGYAAKESIFHTLWEQDTFLEKYLK